MRGWLGLALCLAASGMIATAALGRTAVALRHSAAFYTPDELATIFRASPLPPLPADPTDRVADNPQAARLGQYLFFDRRFAANGAVACATCHQPSRAFADGRMIAKGIALGTRNTPTVLGAAYDQWFFWDGRADSMWSQALQPFENPREMGSDRLAVAHAVADNPALRQAYERIFGPLPPLGDRARFPAHARPDPDPQSTLARAWAGMAPADRIAVDRVFSNLGKAIEAYERKLLGGASPFDRYVAGLKAHDPVREGTISLAAKRGLRLFVGAANCELCHSGPTFSDEQFHNIGLPLLPGEAPDPGRAAGIRLVRDGPFNGIGRFSDDPAAAKDRIAYLPSPSSQLGAFKTPSLRNVALTAPYMHDGRFATLKQVLAFYAEGKAASRGRLIGTREATENLVPHLTASQQAELIAFLKTLSSAPVGYALSQAPATP